MIVVTSGRKYLDIDAYATCIGYAKLLNLKGIEAKAISTAKLNGSITPSLLNLGISLDEYETNEKDKYILIDVSNPDFFETFVKEEKIVGIIDHHIGYEDYWNRRLKNNARIEFIGSVATIVFELYQKENLLEDISKDLAMLLMAAILDNTVNLKAKITSQRDIDAYNKLEEISAEKNFAEKYFEECQLGIDNNLKESIENDTKIEKINSKLPPVFAQLSVWSKESILQKKQIIYETLSDIGEEWMLNLICLSDGKSYFVSNNSKVHYNMEEIFNKQFKNNMMELDNVWLRKEIIKKGKEFNKHEVELEMVADEENINI